MKIYTKILIGMAIGAIIGLTLGPKSGFLEHDAYAVDSVSDITLLLDKDDPSSEISLPQAKYKTKKGTLKNERLVLHAKETITAEVLDGNGQPQTMPTFVRVEFEFGKKMALADKEGTLSLLLGDAKIGQKVEAWLVVKHISLDSGDLLATPVPVSSVGLSVVKWTSPLGDLFMALIKLVIVPLVFCSLVVGVAGLGDVRKLGRLGGKTLGLYMCTTAGAVTIGLLVAHAIQPGNFVAEKDRAALTASFGSEAGLKADNAATAPPFVQNVLSIIPDNPMNSLSQGDMLQIIFFAFIFGIALTMLEKHRATQVVNFLDTVQHAMILIIHMVMAVAPYGVAALIAQVVGESGVSILSALAIYGLTVVLGLLILATVVYGGLVRFVAKLPFVQFLKAARPAQLIAFSTSSSSAALPITLECAEENLGISKSVSSFVIPLGSTVNMDGTALYQGVAALFIAQVFQIDLTLGAQLGIVLAATMASIGAAGVPGAGMITLAMVLTSAGIPTVGVALILGVDRLLDMFRTAVNVTGDLAVTAVMASAEGEEIRFLSSDEDLEDKTRGFEGRTDREPAKIEPEGDAERED